MNALLPLTALFLTAACGAAPAEANRADEQWLLGRWLLVEAGSPRDLAACASHLPILYSADGTFGSWEEEGTWKLEGDRLIETATAANADAQPVEVEIGRPFVSRVERIGADEMRKTYEDGMRGTLLRCPVSR